MADFIFCNRADFSLQTLTAKIYRNCLISRPRPVYKINGFMTMSKKIALMAAFIISTNVLSACTTATEPETARISVSKAEFGAQWPVSVEKGELECIDGYDAVLQSGGITYALNGNVRQKAEKGIYHDVEEIWLDNPAIPGAKKDISVLLRPAVDKLCKFQ